MPVPRTKEQCSEARNRKQQIAISEGELVAHDQRPRRRAPRVVARRCARASPSGSESQRRHPRRASPVSCRRRRAAGRSCSVAAPCSVASRSSAAACGSGLAAGGHPQRRRRARQPTSAQDADRRPRGRRARGVAREPRRRHLPGGHRRGDRRASSARVPAAVVTFAMTAQSQHKDHAAAWNGVLTGAGKKAVTGVDLTVKKSVDTAFKQVKDVPGLAKLALDARERRRCDLPRRDRRVKSPAGIKTAATIQPVEMQHAGDPELPARPVPGPGLVRQDDGARTGERQDRVAPCHLSSRRPAAGRLRACPASHCSGRVRTASAPDRR